MKLTAVFLLVLVLHVSARGFSQNVTLNVQNASLEKIFKEIRKQTGYVFFYKTSLLKDSPKINLVVKNAGIREILNLCLSNLPVEYSIVDGTVVLSPKKSIPVTHKEEIHTPIPVPVQGIVTGEDGKPLSGASVIVKGTNIGTTTDAGGRFSLDVTSYESTLVISYVGFTTLEIKASDSELKIALIQQNKSSDEIVVIAYGTSKRSDLTGAISSVSSEKITQVKGVSNVAQALQGQAAGVQVNQASGQPGEGMKIQIRGTNSMRASNDPLFVVDGLPLDALSAQLNPDDIENIQILKDASSIAIYGSRGANGVVLITTKKGKIGKTSVAYDGYVGTQSLRKKIDVISAADFARLQNEVITNDNASGINSPVKPLPWTDSQLDSLQGKGTDWQNLVYRPALMQDHNISISGGNDKTRFYTSFGYFDQDGIILNAGFRRLSFRTNLNQKITDKLQLNTSVSIQNSIYKQAVSDADGGGGIAFTSMVIPPTQQVYDAQGNYTKFTGVQWGETNPVGISKEIFRRSGNLRVIGNTALNYEIADGLKLMLSAGADAGFSKGDYFAPRTVSIGNASENVNGVTVPLPGVASKNYSNSLTFITENTLSYLKTFNAVHTIDAVGGITYQKTRSENLSGSANGFVTDAFQNNNLGATLATNRNGAGSGYSDFALLSYLGRINYSYAGKYLLTLTGRYDGSSKFGTNNKYAFFPSGAVAWNIDKEDFMRNIAAISSLKIRASFGVAGTQAIDPYQTLPRLSNTTVYLGGNPNTAYRQGSLDNASLKWESTRQFDIGFDLGLLKNRVLLTADYYHKTTRDLLLPVQLPPTSGFGSVTGNVGSLQNVGYEFQLTTRNIEGKNFNWSSTITLSHNKNELISLGTNPATGETIKYLEFVAGGNWFPSIVGQGIAELYGYNVTGVYGTKQEAIDNGEPQKNPGDYKFQNLGDRNHAVDASDRAVLTHLQPKFTYGFNNSFSYKNFDLSILIVGSYGNDIVNEFRKYNLTLNGNWAPTYEAYNSRWQQPGDGGFDKPSSRSGSSIRDYANSLWVENGSYLRVRDITLGYNLSPGLLSRIKLSAIRVFVSAQNYITITNYSGYDPEAAWATSRVNGWDRGVYPSSKSLSAGLKVKF